MSWPKLPALSVTFRGGERQHLASLHRECRAVHKLVTCVAARLSSTPVGPAQVWTMFFYQVIAALIIFQLSMLALLSLKQSVVPAILVIPLLPLTLLFMYFCSAIFKRPFQVLSLRAAVDLDEYRQVRLPMSLTTQL